MIFMYWENHRRVIFNNIKYVICFFKRLAPIIILCLIINCAYSQFRILKSSVIELSDPSDSIPFNFETNRVIITLDYFDIRDSIIAYFDLDSIAETDGKVHILYMDGYWASDSFAILEDSLKIDLTDSTTALKYTIQGDIISINDTPIENLQVFTPGFNWSLDYVVANFLLRGNAKVYNKNTKSYVDDLLFDIKQYNNEFGTWSSFYFPDGIPFLTVYKGFD
jgi:hypothetical protein